jgi:NADH-quinone oxidoreductase subunit E
MISRKKMSKVQDEISIATRGKEELLEILKEVQDRFGCLSGELLVEIAKSLGLPVSEVYGVATFYSFLSTKPQGRNVIRICKSLPCILKNGQTIIESVAREIGIKPGETTLDGKFSFQLTNCIGACDKAPAMMINNDVYTDLTPSKISQILRSYK